MTTIRTRAGRAALTALLLSGPGVAAQEIEVARRSPQGASSGSAPALVAVPVDLQGTLDTARERAGVAGAGAAVVQDGRLIWEGVSGLAVASPPAPMAHRTLFSLASLTKLVTATLIVALRDEGRLDLDDPIARYGLVLPDAERITVRMLLAHRSGLDHYEDDREIDRRLGDPHHPWTRAEVLAAVRGTSFSPGTEFEYANSNYVALGGVVESATGSTVEDTFDRLIARPLGLSRCSFGRDPALAPDVASGHDRRGRPTFPPDGSVPTDVWGPVWTDGGLACAAGDVAVLVDALFGGRLLRASSVAEMSSLGHDGYGLGVSAGPDEGGSWLGHDGAYGGFESAGWYDPVRRLAVVALVNQEDRDGADRIFAEIVGALR